MELAYSVNRVPIHLTYERWCHIVENHDEMAGSFHDVLDTIERPEFVARGHRGALKAVRSCGKRKWLIVIYREISSSDGFVITAYHLRTKPRGDVAWRQ